MHTIKSKHICEEYICITQDIHGLIHNQILKKKPEVRFYNPPKME